MKKISLVLLSLCASTSLLASYPVENPEGNGYTVSADDYLIVTTPKGDKLQLTDFPYVEKNYNIAPVATIICSWDPTGKWLVIFTPLRQITTISVVDLEKGTKIPVNNVQPDYPEWFGTAKVLSTRTTPQAWNGNVLSMTMEVNFKSEDANPRPIQQTLTIDGANFTIQCVPETPTEEIQEVKPTNKASKLGKPVKAQNLGGDPQKPSALEWK